MFEERRAPGQYVYLANTDIDSNGRLECEIEVTPTGDDDAWGSAVLITVSDSSYQNATQLVYVPTSERHSFDIRLPNGPQSYSYRSTFLSLLRGTDRVFASLSWSEDGKIDYEAKDGDGQRGSGFIVNDLHQSQKLSVTASGAKGLSRCVLYEE